MTACHITGTGHAKSEDRSSKLEWASGHVHKVRSILTMHRHECGHEDRVGPDCVALIKMRLRQAGMASW